MRLDLRLTPEQLAALKESTKGQLDAFVGTLRARFITVAPGMELVYKTKEEEARAYLADPNIDPQFVRHILDEADGLGITPTEMATIVVQMAEQWRVVSARMEKKRAAVKKAIDEATTGAGVRAAMVVDWEAVLDGTG